MSDERRPILPAPFERGQVLRAADLESVRQAVAFALGKMIGAGPGILVSRRGDKYLISAQRRQGAPRSPFEIYTVNDGTDISFGVRAGLANGQTPTLGGDPLTDNPAPLVVITASRAIWIKCVATFGSPDTYVFTIENTADLSTVPTAEAISGTGFTSCLALGEITIASGVVTGITQLVQSNLGVESYGNINNWWAV